MNEPTIQAQIDNIINWIIDNELTETDGIEALDSSQLAEVFEEILTKAKYASFLNKRKEGLI